MLPFPVLAATLSAPLPSMADVIHLVTGDCRIPADGTVLVCGHRDSPYRLPPALRDPGFDVDGPLDSLSRERHKLMETGESGTGSCSNVGAGGWTGCMVKGWKAADEQRGFRPAGRLKK